MMSPAGPARGCAGGDRGRAFRAGRRRLRIAAHHRRGAGARDRPVPARPPRHRPGCRLRHGPVHPAAARCAARRLAAGRGRCLGGHAGTAQRRQPWPRPWGGPAAINRRRAAGAGRQPRPGHRVQLRAPLRPRPIPGRRRPGAGARRPAVHLHPHPPCRTRARSGAATSPASPRTSSACTARPRSATPSGGPAGSRWPPPRTSTTRAPAPPGGSGPRPRDGTTRPSPSTLPKSCVPPSLPSWPACPAAKCPGSTSTSWSSPTGAATRHNPAAQPARRTRPSPARPSRSAPGAPARLPQHVPAAARRPPRNAPSRSLPATFGSASIGFSRASIGGCARARARPWLSWPPDG
jgi:hypothetical protein